MKKLALRHRQPFIWATHYYVALAIYPHARTGRPAGRSQSHAYLMLLRMEVTAFHPAGLPGLSQAPYGDDRIGADLTAHPTDSSLWPYSSVSRHGKP